MWDIYFITIDTFWAVDRDDFSEKHPTGSILSLILRSQKHNEHGVSASPTDTVCTPPRQELLVPAKFQESFFPSSKIPLRALFVSNVISISRNKKY